MRIKTKFLSVLSAALLVTMAFVIGDLLEFEFPYFLTLRHVERSKTTTGESAKSTIGEQLGIASDQVHFHRCSYCKNFESQYPSGMLRIEVVNNSTQVFAFAYDSKMNVLHPADDATAQRFPGMGAPVEQKKQ